MRRIVEIPRSPGGYGFRLKNERPCLIDHVLTGSNAEKSGVRVGDILLKVNGVNVISATHEEVASLIWRCHKKLFIEVESQESRSSQCIIGSLESSHQDSHCMISSEHKTYSRTTSVLIYAGCVSVPAGFKSHTEELSILRRKTNSVVNKIHVHAISICLVDIRLGVLQVHLHDTYTAKYPVSCLHSAGHVDSDEKFLYIVTRSKNKGNANTIKVNENRGKNASVKLMNCHVFRTLPAKFLSHSGHIAIAKTFGINCSYDRLTGECCNFPSSTTCALSHLQTMLGNSGLQSTMNIGDLRSVSRRSSEIYHSSANISSTEFHTKSNSIAISFQDPNYHANQPKRSRNSLPEPINPNLISKFLKATSSLSSRIVSSKNSLETVKTNCDEQLPKISCFSSTTEIEDTENIEPPNDPSSASSNPMSWAKDFDNLLNDPVGCNEFRKFLITEFSSENLDFLLSVRSWRHSFETGNVYTLMKTDSFPRFLESSNYSSIINNFNVNKSSRKSTVLNQSKSFKNKTDVSLDRMSSKISTTINRPGKDDGKLISSQVKSCKHGSSQVNKSKIVVMHKSDKTATPSAEIKDKLNKEFNNNSFKSNLIRLKSKFTRSFFLLV
ncbi:unnamed protein product [Schistosoma haematobium]|nr:unnamed protein product [Schistosoma haematobium]